jgi:hypothetical protein
VKRGRAVLETIHLFALAMWMGTLATTGAFAGVTFREMRGLDPHLPAFAAYPNDHWVIAGGRVMAQAFVLSDLVQLACALVAGITLAALAIGRRIDARRAANTLRLVLVAALVVSLLHYLIILSGEMTANLKQFWKSAALGDTDAADTFRARFDALHPRASARMALHLGGVGLAFVLGAWAATTPERGDVAPRVAAPPAEPSTKLEVPDLAKRPLR